MYTNDSINYQKSWKTNIGYDFPCKTLLAIVCYSHGGGVGQPDNLEKFADPMQ